MVLVGQLFWEQIFVVSCIFSGKFLLGLSLLSGGWLLPLLLRFFLSSLTGRLLWGEIPGLCLGGRCRARPPLLPFLTRRMATPRQKYLPRPCCDVPGADSRLDSGVFSLYKTARRGFSDLFSLRKALNLATYTLHSLARWTHKWFLFFLSLSFFFPSSLLTLLDFFFTSSRFLWEKKREKKVKGRSQSTQAYAYEKTRTQSSQNFLSFKYEKQTQSYQNWHKYKSIKPTQLKKNAKF